VEAMGLPEHRLVPGEPKPGHILENGGNEFLARASLVQIFQSDQETLARPGRGQGGEGMAHMQKPCWRRREACNDHGGNLDIFSPHGFPLRSAPCCRQWARDRTCGSAAWLWRRRQ